MTDKHTEAVLNVLKENIHPMKLKHVAMCVTQQASKVLTSLMVLRDQHKVEHRSDDTWGLIGGNSSVSSKDVLHSITSDDVYQTLAGCLVAVPVETLAMQHGVTNNEMNRHLYALEKCGLARFVKVRGKPMWSAVGNVASVHANSDEKDSAMHEPSTDPSTDHPRSVQGGSVDEELNQLKDRVTRLEKYLCGQILFRDLVTQI
jgi:hypothetical protein